MSGLRGAGAAGALALAIFISAAFTAVAAPYAALVMDARTGKVLHARSADKKLHPASLTKMMTLYMAFEAIGAGTLKLDQKVRVSAHAARQVPSKIGLRKGQRVSIRDLIRATAVKSANDAAVALGEAISGSESAFAAAMTKRARRLGMANTTFRNASGLTHSRQRSTARDMALLGRSLFYDFPQYYNLFGRTKTRTVGRTVYSTNRRLLRDYRGADGIKTGYTRAAGYNLVSSAQRGDKRIIAVVLGGRTSRWRNARIAELLNMGFARAPAKAPVIRAETRTASVSRSPAPRPRPFRAAEPSVIGRVAAEVGAAIVPAAAASEITAADIAVAGSRFAPFASPTPLRRPGGEAQIARPAPRPTTPSGSKQADAGWKVQLGVFAKEETAIAELASATLSDIDGLSTTSRTIRRTEVSGRKLWRAQLTGLDKGEATDACRTLKTRGRDCLTIAPK